MRNSSQSSSVCSSPGGGGARALVVDEHHAVADEDLVADLDSVADERVALDLAALADARAALHLHERADARVVPDRAAVEVREGVHDDALAESDVGDQAMSCGVTRLERHAEELADLVDDPGGLFFRHPREDRERQHLPCEALRDREVARAVAEARVGSTEMRGLGIVKAGRDAALVEERGKLVTEPSAHDVEMPYGLAAGGNRRDDEVADTLEALFVGRRNATPVIVPPVELRELPEEDRRLNRVEAGRPADQVVTVLLTLAVLPQHPDALDKHLVVRDEGTCIAEGSEVLPRIEAEGSRHPGRTRANPVAAGAMGLASVLDDREPALPGDPRDLLHVGQLAVEVDGHDRFRVLRDRAREGRGVEVVIGRGGVDRHGRGA